MRNASILILDEATSALDLETEERIQHEIEKTYGEKTVIIVAHRLQTIEKADRILVFHEGSFVETGKYSDLMGSPSYFRNFARG